MKLLCTGGAISVHRAVSEETISVDVIDVWSGRRATALQKAMRLSNEAFAAHLGYRDAHHRQLARQARNGTAAGQSASPRHRPFPRQ